MRGRPKAELVLTQGEREQLQSWARRRKTSQALAMRSRIVLECASGLENQVVAQHLETSPQTVCKWRNRFAQLRVPGWRMNHAAGAESSTMRASNVGFLIS